MDIPEKPPLGSWTVLSFPTFSNEKKTSLTGRAGATSSDAAKCSPAKPWALEWEGDGFAWEMMGLCGFIWIYSGKLRFHQWKTMD